jgi:hypothetical protein
MPRFYFRGLRGVAGVMRRDRLGFAEFSDLKDLIGCP